MILSRSGIEPAPSLVGRRLRARRGLTLVELMIGLVLTLMLVGAMVQVFGLLGDSVRRSRALIDLSNQLRTVSNLLQSDLNGVTLHVRPWISSQSNLGYMEILEGLGQDGDLDADGTFFEAAENSPALVNPNGQMGTFANGQVPTGTLYGDVDDILMFTTRNDQQPFVGRVSNAILFGNASATPQGYTLLESSVAEVVWWVQRDEEGNVRLFRRVLLVMPELKQMPGVAQRLATVAFGTPSQEQQFFRVNDLSVRPDPSGSGVGVLLNTLGDLTLRENRFAHTRKNFSETTKRGFDPAFPYRLVRALLPEITVDPVTGSNRYGPIVLTDLLAFDVRVFDPQAPLNMSKPVVLTPSDPGYIQNVASDASSVASFAATGAFVDLGFGRRLGGSTSWPASHFSGLPNVRSRLAAGNSVVPGGTFPALVYDTWPDDYERDGLDQDRDNRADEGHDGLDNDDQNGVDDPGEFETAPPYAFPLRGVEVRIRTWDVETRQIRQVSVVGDFLPE